MQTYADTTPPPPPCYGVMGWGGAHTYSITGQSVPHLDLVSFLNQPHVRVFGLRVNIKLPVISHPPPIGLYDTVGGRGGTDLAL